MSLGGCSRDRTGIEGRSFGGAGVYGHSSSGDGIVAKGGRWAARFEGDILLQGHCTFKEEPMPAAPGTNQAQLQLRDNGSGNSELVIQFAGGAVQVLATEP